jgi:hypothetical protein
MEKSDEKPTAAALEVTSSAVEKQQPHIKTDEKLSALKSFKKSPWAVIWCLYMLFTCVMWYVVPDEVSEADD